MIGLPSLLAALGIVGVGFALLSFVVVLFSGAGVASDLAWVGGNLVVGVILLVSAAVLNFDALRERMASGEARRAGKYGTSAILSTILGIAILGALGFLATRYHHRFDLSEAGIHTLSDQSKKVLENLDSDVDVLALVGPGQQDAVHELLDKYAYESDRFHVEYADPNERPGLLQKYDITPDELGQGGLVRVAIGGDDVKVTDITEENVTNAMVKLTRTGEKVVYFLQGHGEMPIEGDAANGREGYARAATALRNENYRVEPLLLASTGKVPADADVVILAGPSRPLFDNELDALERYMARGGSVMALVDPRVRDNLVDRIKSWGVTLGDDLVIDRALALFGRAATPMAGRYAADHPITSALRDPRNDPTMFHEVRSVQPDDAGGKAGAKGKGRFTEIVFTGEASWAERDLAKLDSESTASMDPGDLPGPVPIAVAGTPTLPPAVLADADGTASGDDDAGASAGDEKGKGSAEPRLVVVGDADFASNEFLDAGRNRDLFLNATNWLIGDVEAISIRPKHSRASRFQLTAAQFRTIRTASLFVLPEAIAVLGVFTWWTRRNPAG